MSNKSSGGESIISLPKGGGAMHGIGETFSPDLQTGTGNFTVPIALPPGRNGFQPQINLVYSTGNGNGPFGLGWNLSVPGITRKISKGIPRYEDRSAGGQDIFILSGAEDLVPTTDPAASPIHYRPRTEGLFARIEHHLEEAGGYWKVATKDGLVSCYGTEQHTSGEADRDPATIADPDHLAHVFAWKLTSTVDPFGNRIEYSYERDASQVDGPHHWDQLYLSEIRYGNYGEPDRHGFLVRVKFVYEERPDPFSEYRSGFEIRTLRRCRRIEIYTHADRLRLTRTYHLVYRDQTEFLSDRLPTNGVSLLHQIWVEGHDDTTEDLLKNSSFEGPEGRSTTFTGLSGAGSSAADRWILFNNNYGTTTTELVRSASPFGGATMIHVTTTGRANGLVQTFLSNDSGPARITASAWVFVKRGRVGIGTGNGGHTGLDTLSSTNGHWEYLEAPNGVSPANEFIIYSANDSGADFYVANTSISEAPRSEWLPSLEFDYTRFEPRQRKFKALTEPDLPASSLANPHLELVDLFGNGLPDVLEMNGTVRYWRNLGEGRFDRPRSMPEAPAGVALADAGVQLIDANGDGRTDLLVTNNELSGYYSLEFGGLWDRKSFQRYEQAPSFNLEDPEVRLVDLTGDGITDVIRSGTRLECFFNDPEKGWLRQNTRWVERKSLDEFPNVNFSDPRVRWADMTGDGLQDVVLVHDGSVDYWPNLGRGNWGRRIRMRSSPRFPYGFDPKRILIGDVDGDGLADIVYVDDNRVTLWVNQSGNGWSAPILIPGTPSVTDMDAVRLIDLHGTGISGVLWSADAAVAGGNRMFFLDFTGGVKPYLLNGMDNHMGAVTKVTYVPSTKFYLADERKPATRWKTPLPFPVQVVERVEVTDELSRGKLTTEYRYHYGYWDGAEREFRGFGMVEQLDTEIFDGYGGRGLENDTSWHERLLAQHMFSPPLLTRTWFHQGPVGEAYGEWAEQDYSSEFWPGDPQRLDHKRQIDVFLQQLPTRRSRRDALRTLRGSVLRTELYAFDGTARQERPYTVTESAYTLREIAPPADGDTPRQHIFFPHLVAQRTTQWERGIDPMTSFGFTSDYDDYGQPRRKLDIACPRGGSLRVDDTASALAAPPGVSRAPTTIPAVRSTSPYLVTLSLTEYAVPLDAPRYIHDRVAKATSYEIVNVSGDRGGARALHEIIEYAEGVNHRRVIAQTLNFYDADPTDPTFGAYTGLPFGQVGQYGAAVRTDTLVMTDGTLLAAYDDQVPPYLVPGNVMGVSDEYPAAFVNSLPRLAGYTYQADGDGSPYTRGYFASAGKRYDFHDATLRGRGLVLAQRDPLDHETTITYDEPYRSFPTSVTDPAGLVTRAEHDYRIMQPGRMTDANGNVSEISFTPTGLAKDIWVKGKPGKTEGDRGEPCVHFEYGLRAFYESKHADPDHPQPVYVRAVKRVFHDTDPFDTGETIETREYSDGFGRLLQTRTQAEEVIFGDPKQGDGILPLDQDRQQETKAPVAGKANSDRAIPNVIVSGWQVYDNKGRVIEKYEPFFDQGWGIQWEEEAKQGVHVTMYYDPRGQVVRTVNPDGSEQRVIYGKPQNVDAPTDLETIVPTPWEAYTYDANDNAGRTHPGQAHSYRHHWNTPASIEIDALGRTIRAVARHREAPDDETVPLPPIEEHVTRSSYDIQGNLLTVADALGRVAFRYTYDLGKRALRTESIDAGLRLSVFDAVGNAVEGRDSKGALVLHAYDVLNRPTRLWARDAADDAVTLREKLLYGDDPSLAGTSPGAQNLLGKLYRHHDEAGVVTTTACDFKGNVLESTRQVLSDDFLLSNIRAQSGPEWILQAPRIDWDTPPAHLLDSSEYRTRSAYDALNRIQWSEYPQCANGERYRLRPGYNRAGALERVDLEGPLNADDNGPRQAFVQRLAYNAKGQRTLIAYGNGVMTRYAYDTQTFRLVRMRTERFESPGELTYQPKVEPLQDIAYGYDPAGNILGMRDLTPGCGVAGNPEAQYEHGPLRELLSAGDALTRSFEYDPLYRLVFATGRESRDIPGPRPWSDDPRGGFNSGNHGTPNQDNAPNLTALYREEYAYDAGGNMLSLRHEQQAQHNGGFAWEALWSRNFGMDGRTPEQWQQQAAVHISGDWPEAPSNRLSHVEDRASGVLTPPGMPQTHFYDANGNMVRENVERHFEWDHADRMKVFRNQVETSKPTVYALYLYDRAGQRVKKLVCKNGIVETTTYLGTAFEHHRRVRPSETLENNTLHVMDDQSRIALVRIGAAFPGDGAAVHPIQYQFGDHLGSSAIVIGGNGSWINREEFFPYGETSFGSFGRKRYRFTGKERDEESGLNYFGARFFNPVLGRWLSTEPKERSRTSNLYVFVESNPVRHSESDGFGFSDFANGFANGFLGGIVGGVVAGAVLAVASPAVVTVVTAVAVAGAVVVAAKASATVVAHYTGRISPAEAHRQYGELAGGFVGGVVGGGGVSGMRAAASSLADSAGGVLAPASGSVPQTAFAASLSSSVAIPGATGSGVVAMAAAKLPSSSTVASTGTSAAPSAGTKGRPPALQKAIERHERVETALATEMAKLGPVEKGGMRTIKDASGVSLKGTAGTKTTSKPDLLFETMIDDTVHKTDIEIKTSSSESTVRKALQQLANKASMGGQGFWNETPWTIGEGSGVVYATDNIYVNKANISRN